MSSAALEPRRRRHEVTGITEFFHVSQHGPGQRGGGHRDARDTAAAANTNPADNTRYPGRSKLARSSERCRSSISQILPNQLNFGCRQISLACTRCVCLYVCGGSSRTDAPQPCVERRVRARARTHAVSLPIFGSDAL
eukprot:3976970-Prymnesium_polylepis.1